jgi:hypothetical protein
MSHEYGLLLKYLKGCQKANNRPIGENSPNQVTLTDMTAALNSSDP